MGRGGYNGGEPSVLEPKEDEVLGSDFSLAELQRFAQPPRRIEILNAGCGLFNNGNSMQPEFGYRVKFVLGSGTVGKHSTQKSLTKRVFRKRSKGFKDISTWVPASFLIRLAPDLVIGYHRNTPNKPRPYGLETAIAY